MSGASGAELGRISGQDLAEQGLTLLDLLVSLALSEALQELPIKLLVHGGRPARSRRPGGRRGLRAARPTATAPHHAVTARRLDRNARREAGVPPTSKTGSGAAAGGNTLTAEPDSSGVAVPRGKGRVGGPGRWAPAAPGALGIYELTAGGMSSMYEGNPLPCARRRRNGRPMGPPRMTEGAGEEGGSCCALHTGPEFWTWTVRLRSRGARLEARVRVCGGWGAGRGRVERHGWAGRRLVRDDNSAY